MLIKQMVFTTENDDFLNQIMKWLETLSTSQIKMIGNLISEKAKEQEKEEKYFGQLDTKLVS